MEVIPTSEIGNICLSADARKARDTASHMYLGKDPNKPSMRVFQTGTGSTQKMSH